MNKAFKAFLVTLALLAIVVAPACKPKKPVVAPSVEGLIYRGPLLAYAKDRDGHRYAVLDTGRVLSAFRTDAPAHAPGLEIRATSAAGRDARGRQVLGWRLEVERQRQRERGRER